MHNIVTISWGVKFNDKNEEFRMSVSYNNDLEPDEVFIMRIKMMRRAMQEAIRAREKQ